MVFFIIRSTYLKLYEEIDGEYKYIGKVKISNSKINISRKTKKRIIGHYKREFSKKYAKKYANENITIINNCKVACVLLQGETIQFVL